MPGNAPRERRNPTIVGTYDPRTSIERTRFLQPLKPIRCDGLTISLHQEDKIAVATQALHGFVEQPIGASLVTVARSRRGRVLCVGVLLWRQIAEPHLKPGEGGHQMRTSPEPILQSPLVSWLRSAIEGEDKARRRSSAGCSLSSAEQGSPSVQVCQGNGHLPRCQRTDDGAQIWSCLARWPRLQACF